jgi:nicotinic acid mononucleotide adenylyltransferase
MPLQSELKQFLTKPFIRDFRWDRYLKEPGKTVRQAVNAANVVALIDTMVENHEWNYRSALKLARQIETNLTAIKKDDENADLTMLMDFRDCSDIQGKVYLQKAGEVYHDVIQPQDREALADETFRRVYIILRRLLPFFNQITSKAYPESWEARYPFEPISDKELAASKHSDEYDSFTKYFYDDGILELMKMSQEFLGFTTLNHVLGVHALAMKIGRQLIEKGYNVDLAILSATSINHDIGKFGCKGAELKRIAYLHYYYTKEWFDRYKMPVLSHVATNHGTWDLESIRLPIETMILIYSDFCVKNKRQQDGSYAMAFFPIEEAFQVIMNMLDNLDEDKKQRYETVYRKLKDLDDLFSLLGVDRNMEDLSAEIDRVNYHLKYNPIDIVKGDTFGDVFALLNTNEISVAFKNLSVTSNFRVQEFLRDVKSLSHIFEQARLEINWKDLRTYLRIIEDFCDYFTHEQRLLTIDFLFELLSHREDDIRYHASNLIAEMIKDMDLSFHKELPMDIEVQQTHDGLDIFYRVLALLDYNEEDPDENLEHKEQRIYNTTLIIRHLFKILSTDKRELFKNTLKTFYPDGRAKIEKPFSILYLAEILTVTLRCFSAKELESIAKFILNYLDHPNSATRFMILELLHALAVQHKSLVFTLEGLEPLSAQIFERLSRKVRSGISAAEINYIDDIFNALKDEIPGRFSFIEAMSQRMDYIIQTHQKNYRSIFLDDFKTKTSWVEKKANCDFLAKFAINKHEREGDIFTCLETAGHFANLLKVSRVEGTRFRAGKRLLDLLPFLEINQINEIAIELLRSLEQDDEGFTQYIPRVLARVMTMLPNAEFDEIVSDIAEGLKSNRTNIRELFLKTLGHTLANIRDSKYDHRAHEEKILSFLVSAVQAMDEHVAKAAYNVLGSNIFHPASPIAPTVKRTYLALIAKKLITQIRNRSNSIISLFHSASCLNQIYKFIAEQEKNEIPIDYIRRNKIAFIPGTFDPFSEGHRELVLQAANSGYEVHIQVDEYSWSKRTLPRLLRKHIVRLAIADLFNVYLNPEEPPFNLANSENLQRLQALYDGKSISIVVGADVITGASAYRNKSEESISIFDFHHLIFMRSHSDQDVSAPEYRRQIKSIAARFKHGYNEMSIDSELAMVSSTRIREQIEKGRPIDDMVDPLVARFIQERRLYVKTPEFKSEVGRGQWSYRLIDQDNIRKTDMAAIADLYQNAFRDHPARSMVSKNEIFEYYDKFFTKQKGKILVLENTSRNNELIGMLTYFEIETVRLLSLVKSPAVSELIREKTAGRLVYSNILAIRSSYQHRNLAFEIKTRAALQWIEEGFMHALSKINASVINKNSKISHHEARLFALNQEMGYEILPLENNEKIGDNQYHIRYMICNLQRPILLINDLVDQFKRPFRHDKALHSIIHINQKNMAYVFRKMYPNNLLLRINNRDLVTKVIERICQVNEVPFQYLHHKRRKLGEHMAILLGQVLGRELVPNTVTKALHSDRTIDRQGKETYFMPYPYYADINSQLQTLRNFNRPPILADLFSLSGNTVMHIIEMAKAINLDIRKVVVGIISGKAQELLLANNIETEHLIFLPRLTNWFNLRHFYPFIGGETINQPFYYRKLIIESMNYIFPYRRAVQLKHINREHFLALSKTALSGAIEIFEFLEDAYLQEHKRELTLLQLPDVMEDPRRPIHNLSYSVNWNERISDILKGDMEQVERYFN